LILTKTKKQATLEINDNGGITKIIVTNFGRGYVSEFPPVFEIVDGGAGFGAVVLGEVMHTNACAYTNTHTGVCAHAHIHTHTHAHTHAQYTNVHTHAHAKACTHTRTHTRDKYTKTHTVVRKYIRTDKYGAKRTHVHTHTHTHTRTHAHTHTGTHKHTHT